MSSREERTGRFHEPEVGAASGGHLASGGGTGPLFDPLDEPLPSERAKREADRAPATEPDPAAERTEAFPRRSEVRAEATRAQPRPQPARRRAGLRRVRRTVRHVDPFSVLKLSGFFYAIFVLLWLVFVAIVYSFLDSTGVFDAIEEFGDPSGMALWEELNISLGVVEKWALFIGITFGIVGTLVNTVIAVLYNVGSDLLGGLELTFVERDVGA
ncbi:MAG TPA: DUF3566 domain-containing protein [Actinomycetota bacterium]|nr:DUF3566 domain-containing protein [Actinomycetota bacterium]